jgi:hypothetical protein
MVSQEFSNGSRLFVGGVEAAWEALHANHLEVDVLVECREGNSRLRGRGGLDSQSDPEDPRLQRLELPANSMAAYALPAQVCLPMCRMSC